MTTNVKDYFLEDNKEIENLFGQTMEGEFELDLFNKSFSNQLKSDKTDTLKPRTKWWMMLVSRERPISNNVCDYWVNIELTLS